MNQYSVAFHCPGRTVVKGFLDADIALGVMDVPDTVNWMAKNIQPVEKRVAIQMHSHLYAEVSRVTPETLLGLPVFVEETVGHAIWVNEGVS